MSILPIILAAAPIVDPVAHSVSFEVVSTDCGLDAPLEFLVAGPGSDHDYEAMFLAENPVEEIAAAFDKAGIPRGSPTDVTKCRFWPVGDEVTIEPDLWTLLKELHAEGRPPVLYTGGARNSAGAPLAAAESPNAIFALYDCPQSLMQFDDSLAQSSTYGRFKCAVKIPKGEKRTLKISWNGRKLHERVALALEPGGLAAAMASLRDKAAKGVELDVTPSFAPSMTVEEAHAAASALAAVESAAVKINGHAEGQFFYRAFLPLERWRERAGRLSQPCEVRFDKAGKPTLTTIEEDWTTNPDSTDPLLIVKENVDFASIAAGSKIDTCLIFAPRAMKLSEVFAVRRLLPAGIKNYYVFAE